MAASLFRNESIELEPSVYSIHRLMNLLVEIFWNNQGIIHPREDEMTLGGVAKQLVVGIFAAIKLLVGS